MIGVDLFCGAGGLSLGASRAGIEIVEACDSDKHALATYSANFPDVRTVLADVRSLQHIDARKVNEPTVLIAGPPCKGFSTSNQRTCRATNPDNRLLLACLPLVRSWRPDWVVIENVRGLLVAEGGAFLGQIETGLRSAGYTVNRWILNAADFGVPQYRTRLFVVASLHGVQLAQPTSDSTAPVTVHEAFEDLPLLPSGASKDCLPYPRSPASAFARLMRQGLDACTGHLVSRNSPLVLKRYQHIGKGENWEKIPDDLMRNYKDKTRCHTGIYRRLRQDSPSVVIGNYRKNMLIHPTQDRGLSVREAARIQSFPDSFQFHGRLGYQQEQVGNAVPPLLSEVVFRKIAANEVRRQLAGGVGDAL